MELFTEHLGEGAIFIEGVIDLSGDPHHQGGLCSLRRPRDDRDLNVVLKEMILQWVNDARARARPRPLFICRR